MGYHMKTIVKSPPPLGSRQSAQRKTPSLHAILSPCEEGGFTAVCREIPGAISEGDTKEEAIENLMDAIKCVLEVTNDMTAERVRSYFLHLGQNARPIKSKMMDLCEAH